MRLFAPCQTRDLSARLLGRITTSDELSPEERKRAILLTDGRTRVSTEGFAAVMSPRTIDPPSEGPAIFAFKELDYLATGDVVSVDPRGSIRVLYRRSSPHNSILMTEQCNSFCLMCSQPPKNVDDRGRVSEVVELIGLIDPETRALGITGGEPTLFGDDFLRVVSECRDRLPETALHVLTNGRSFYYREFAQRLGAIGHPDLVLGIPLYSSVDWWHDYVVQARGAFEETVIGLQHLEEAGVQVEIRVVLHRLTIPHLTMLAEFVARNLPFVSHVALMGLEMFGFARPNIELLWIDPFDYQSELASAAEILALSGMNISIYNHQLCTLPKELWPFSVRSISDWKNVYLPECEPCSIRERCGGFFQSAGLRHSAHIRPITNGA